MTPKKSPERQCVGCRTKKPKRELIRVVRSPEGAVSLDTGRLPGRGAYLCRSAECLKRARKSRALERAFGAPVPEDVFLTLEQDILALKPVDEAAP